MTLTMLFHFNKIENVTHLITHVQLNVFINTCVSQVLLDPLISNHRKYTCSICHFCFHFYCPMITYDLNVALYNKTEGKFDIM